MAYSIRARKADGTRVTERVASDGSRCIITRKPSGAAGIIVRNAKGRREVGYNFSGKIDGVQVSKQEREAQIREGLRDLREDYKHTRGMSKGGTRKHLASIPPEIWYGICAEDGPEAVQDRKYMMKVASKWGFKL